MTKFNLEFSFGADIDKEAVERWLEILMESLPEGAEGILKEEPMVLNLEQLEDAHKGRSIRFHTPVTGTIEGVLEGIHPSGDWAKSLVVDGRAYHVTFAAIEVLN